MRRCRAAANVQFGKPSQEIVAATCARSAHDRDALGDKAAGDESEDLCGGLIEPLRVIDDADERLPLGDRAKRVSVASPTRKGSGAGPTFNPKTVASASRCGAGSRSRGQARRRTADATPRMRAPSRTQRLLPGRRGTQRRFHQVLQKRRLADSGLAAQDQHPTLTLSHTVQQSIEGLAFAPPAHERGSVSPIDIATRAAVSARPRTGLGQGREPLDRAHRWLPTCRGMKWIDRLGFRG